MNYEKKYNEALNLAKSYYGKGTNEFLDTIFPELKEDEDERIRKWIINEIKATHDYDSPTSKKCVDDALAYLEKQKEPHYSPLCNTIKDKIREYIANHFIADTVVKTDMRSIVKAMEEGVRLGKEEQKSAEWNEEDESAFEDLIWCIEQARKSAKDENDMGNIWYAENWLKERLKSLRPQPQHRDTYYDIIHDILATLKNMDFTQITPEHRVSLLNDIRVKCKNADECAAILDEPHWKPSEQEKGALRTAIHVLTEERNFPKAAAQLENILNTFEGEESRKDWKPSEEQMYALKNVVETYRQRHNISVGGDCIFIGVESLYNDLKKL